MKRRIVLILNNKLIKFFKKINSINKMLLKKKLNLNKIYNQKK